MIKRVYNIKKILFLSFLILLVFILVGCETDLPPEPGSPGPIGGAIVLYESYAPPYDVFNSNATVFSISRDRYVIAPPMDSISFDIDVSHTGAFIYKLGYYYNNSGSEWEMYEFPQSTFEGTNWILDASSRSVTIGSDALVEGENYIVAYSCKKYNGLWKCGCSTVDGPCNQWMLQAFEVFEVPPEPPTPGGRPSCGNGVCESGEDVNCPEDCI